MSRRRAPTAPTGWSSSTRRRAGRPTTSWPSPAACSAPARSATPAPSTPTPPACCCSASVGSPGCCASSPRCPKTYTGDIVLGVETSTLDAVGRGDGHPRHGGVTLADVERRPPGLTGDILQVPADGLGGQGRRQAPPRAGPGGHRGRARAPARSPSTASTSTPTADPLVVRAEVECSSGTYVRTLAADLGHALGGGAHLRDLRRTAVGSFAVDEARRLDAGRARGRCSPRPRPLRDYAVGRWPTTTTSWLSATARCSTRDELAFAGDGPWAVLDGTGRLLAVYGRPPRHHREARGRPRPGRRAPPAPTSSARGRRAVACPTPWRSSATSRPAPGPKRARSSRSVPTTACTSGHRAVIAGAPAAGRGRGSAHRGGHLRPAPGRRSCAPSRRRCCSPTSTRSSSSSADCGVDYTLVIRFDEERSNEPADDFVDARCWSAASTPRSWSSARTSTSATGARATSALLQEMGAELGFEVIGHDLVDADGQPDRRRARCRRPRIRQALADGDLVAANGMLGRPHEVRGVVAHGDEPGPELGFPTANVAVPDDICLPADGIYAGWYVTPRRRARARPPSPSDAGRRSTSTPTRRCSRPTSSTSTATSTASPPGCSSCSGCATS